MKHFKLYILAFTSLFVSTLFAQSTNSYDQMETRFNKKKLSHEDSLAFKEAGIQKAKTLFEYGDVYMSNSSNQANQTYVTTRVPELFYVPKGDTLNTDSIFLLVNKIIEIEKPNSVELVFFEKEGVLGHVVTATRRIQFEADIILIRVPKQFGKTKDKVWQVFLANPEFHFYPPE